MLRSSPYKIVAAARTDAYLPLFLAEARDWYDCLPKEDIHLVPPEGIENDADGKPRDQNSWVIHRLLNDDDVILEICYPFKVRNDRVSDRTKIIGSLLSKATFWIYDTNESIDNIHELVKFNNIVCPSSGMTGYRFFELIRVIVQEKHQQEWNPAALEERIEHLFHTFETAIAQDQKANTGRKSIVITPNPYDIAQSSWEHMQGR